MGQTLAEHMVAANLLDATMTHAYAEVVVCIGCARCRPATTPATFRGYPPSQTEGWVSTVAVLSDYDREKA